ncbi:MAG: EAL domain-containing protein (putative c-di-GMP-specific phosphodiesterase class I) [Moritella dasanensis]|jgi:EAL domain-containing protein (putative c-di-GMP-specific phosphodiesterase class I)/GGDEF domain-containing protein
MSLSKKLQIFQLFIFMFIFAVNFFISVYNSKDYLQTESYNKAQDTATALSLSLSPLLNNPNDAEIASIITAIADKGFFKEVSLHRINKTFTAKQLLMQADNQLLKQGKWLLTEVTLEKKYGQLSTNIEQSKIASLLNTLNDEKNIQAIDPDISWIRFTPSSQFVDGQSVHINFKAIQKNSPQKEITATALINVDRSLFTALRNDRFEETPLWFVRLFPIKSNIARAMINHGWKKVAVVSVSTNPGQAYHRLYQHASQAARYSLIALLFSMLVLTVFLNRTLKPLQKIQTLTEDIAKGHFNTISTVPKTDELKKLTLAINDMSMKLAKFFNKLNDDINIVNQKINLDALTQLPLKPSFELAFKNSIDSSGFGYIFLVKIINLASINQKNSPAFVDNMICDFAKLLNNSCNMNNLKDQSSPAQISAYRFFGGEFVLLFDNANFQQAQQFANELSKELTLLTHQLQLTELSQIGAAAFTTDTDFITVLNSANEAFEFAKQVGPNEAIIHQQPEQARDKQQWQALVEQCVKHGEFSIDYINPCQAINIITGDDTSIMMEAFTRIHTQDGHHVAMATFISIVEEINFNVDFDQQVTKKIISDIKHKKIGHNLLINLSVASINDLEFIDWLETVLTENNAIAPQLFFSISAYSAAKQKPVLKRFIDKIHSLGSKIIIKRYETALLSLSELQSLQIDAIRFAKEYTNDIATEAPKQQLIKNMLEFSQLMDISLYTEEVINPQDATMLTKLAQ